MRLADARTLGIALVACALTQACGTDEGALSVDLRTDLVAPEEFAHVQTLLARQPFGTGGESRQRELDALAGTDFIRSARVAEFDAVAQGPQYLRVRLLARDGALVAARDVTIDYAGDLAIIVTITRSCRGVTCPGATDPATHSACFGGSCIDPSCRPEAAGMCTTPECARDDQCAGGMGCLGGRCIDGACLVAPDDARCGGAGQRCNALGVCVAASIDAGPSSPDAGARDAGPSSSDAGPTPRDAGPTAMDAGPAPMDASVGRRDGGPRDAGPPPPPVDAGRDSALATSFCPASPTTRAQGAVYVVKLMHGTDFLPPPAVGMFSDVPAGDIFAPWIEQLARDGITAGCGSGMYCPTLDLIRSQAAVFIVRAVHGALFVPPPAVGLFSDVPTMSVYAPYIEQLVNDGFAAGCGGGMFCPDAAMLRRQIAPTILYAEHGAGYSPPPATGTVFIDVPMTLPEAPFIEQFAIEGFAVGCGG